MAEGRLSALAVAKCRVLVERRHRCGHWQPAAASLKLRLVEAPDVRYARSGGLSIAYQVVGDGPIDLVFVPFLISTVFTWQHPLFVTFYKRLASFSRLILLDNRGTGASDRPRTPPTLEAQMDDVRAVLDEVGSEQAALFGGAHGGQMCALFAATYPERTSALVLYNAWSRLPGTDEEHRRMIRRFRDEWWRTEVLKGNVQEQYPSLVGDESFLHSLMMIMRASASPSSAAEFIRTAAEADIAEVLPLIRVPTLLLYRRDLQAGPDLLPARDPEEQARHVAGLIPHARVVAVPGQDIAPFVGEEIPGEVERFLRAPLAEPVPDRVLATVLFTDIVGSTERAAALGDRGWRELLARHRQDVRRELQRFAGVELDTAGDGFFASFDGPARGITCAQAIVASAAEHGLDVRAGLHTGECEREGGREARRHRRSHWRADCRTGSAGRSSRLPNSERPRTRIRHRVRRPRRPRTQRRPRRMATIRHPTALAEQPEVFICRTLREARHERRQSAIASFPHLRCPATRSGGPSPSAAGKRSQ
jgi:pimeloyl-ACP methyl ester carboxylesterase